jgi:hypothetical protein
MPCLALDDVRSKIEHVLVFFVWNVVAQSEGAGCLSHKVTFFDRRGITKKNPASEATRAGLSPVIRDPYASYGGASGPASMSSRTVTQMSRSFGCPTGYHGYHTVRLCAAGTDNRQNHRKLGSACENCGNIETRCATKSALSSVLAARLCSSCLVTRVQPKNASASRSARCGSCGTRGTLARRSKPKTSNPKALQQAGLLLRGGGASAPVGSSSCPSTGSVTVTTTAARRIRTIALAGSGRARRGEHGVVHRHGRPDRGSLRLG